jgi:7,8-dihydropterin-6-yl-methyl-4-(beta-D-ribofuranosyl)aminobenzene 5'-phosphate synthase
MSGNLPGGISMQEVDTVRIWILTDNYYDALRPDNAVAMHYRVPAGESIHAEHGLAYFIETVIDGKTSTCVFDFGLDPNGVIHNAKLLKLDLGNADAFVLSHGHFDHWTGALEILKQKSTKASPRFYAGEEAFLHRYSRGPNRGEPMDIGQLTREAIMETGVQVTEVRWPTEVIPGCSCTGNIERVTDYEKVPPSLLVERDGKIQQDDFRGEQALFIVIRGKGLVILSGCAHAGIVNTVKQAQRVAGISKVHAVIGGFHLINADQEIIQNTLADIRAIGPDFIIPAHCTGFEALVVFSQAMPDEFILNTAATQYTFSAMNQS